MFTVRLCLRNRHDSFAVLEHRGVDQTMYGKGHPTFFLLEKCDIFSILQSNELFYTLLQMFRNFLKIFYSEAPGAGSVTPCHEVVDRSMVKVENDPVSLTLTQGLQNKIFTKSCETFEEECRFIVFAYG